MRKILVVVALVPLTLLFVRTGTEAQDKEPAAEAARPFKAVVHINFPDAERQKHGLKNVSNMLKTVKTNFEIEVVCHGDGIGLLVEGRSKHAAEIERLSREGVRFAACENTMRDRSITKDQLLHSVVMVPSGAVEVVRKQQESYGYFKP